MQTLYTYTKFFQPSEVYDKSFTKKMLKALTNLSINIYKNPPEKTKYDHRQWDLPYNKPYLDKYNDIIFIYAKLTGVKVMFKDIIHMGGIRKSLLLIGEKSRVRILSHILDHYFKGYFEYQQWIRINLFEEAKKNIPEWDIRAYASKLLKEQADTIYKFTKSLLKEDDEARYKLESYINEQMKLDYKDYKTDKHTYDHAINTHYRHRRMLL